MTAGQRPPIDVIEPSPPVARRRRPLHRSWVERILLTAGVVATTGCLLVAGVLTWALQKFEAIETVEIASVEQAAAGEPSNWLLVGTDSREGIDEDDPNADVFIGGDPSQLPSGKRTDTMIVARVDPYGQTIDLLSIPRDLQVPIAGADRESRINSAFNAENGEERLVNTIEAFFGFEINHYAEVNFVGFQDIVDELGGIPMWFDRPMRDANSGLDATNAGCRVLDGFQALAFARSRHLEYFDDGRWQSDPTGDLGRSSRQQYFLRRVVDTAAAQVDLTSLGKINSLITVGGSNLVIDQGVEPGDLLGLARTFADAGSERVIGHSLPVFDFRTSEGAAVLGLEFDAAQPILDIFRGLAPSAAAEGADVATATTTTTIPLVRSASVLNGSGVAGQAGQTAAGLETAGFEVEVGDAEERRPDTIVRYPSALAPVAAELISLLATDPEIQLDDSLDEVVLITGSDFLGLAAEQRPATPLGTAPQTPSPSTAPPTSEPVGVVPAASPEGTACG
jgi:LCP family protein required for cell wall assembly